MNIENTELYTLSVNCMMCELYLNKAIENVSLKGQLFWSYS